MTSNALKREVLQTFKKLHRTSSSIFKDESYVKAARGEINKAYKKNKNITSVESIRELIKFANEVIYELKTTVVELEETSSGTYRLKLRPEMFEDNNEVKGNPAPQKVSK